MYEIFVPIDKAAVKYVVAGSVVVLLFVTVNTPGARSVTVITTDAGAAVIPRASVTIRLNVSTVGVNGVLNVGVKKAVGERLALSVTGVPPV